MWVGELCFKGRFLYILGLLSPAACSGSSAVPSHPCDCSAVLPEKQNHSDR